MKTQNQYATEIGEIVKRDVQVHQADWFEIDRNIFMAAENENKSFLLATRKCGCELLMLQGNHFNEQSINRILGALGNEHFYICKPKAIYSFLTDIREITGCQVVKEIQTLLPPDWYLIFNVNLNTWLLKNLIKSTLL